MGGATGQATASPAAAGDLPPDLRRDAVAGTGGPGPGARKGRERRLLARAVAAGVAVLACTAGSIPTIRAETARPERPRAITSGGVGAGWYRIHTGPSGGCVGLRDGGERRVHLIQEDCRAVPEQRFYFERFDGFYRIQAARSKADAECMTVDPTASGSVLRMSACEPFERAQRMFVAPMPGERHSWLPARLVLRPAADPGSRALLGAKRPDGWARAAKRPADFTFYLTAEE